MIVTLVFGPMKVSSFSDLEPAFAAIVAERERHFDLLALLVDHLERSEQRNTRHRLAEIVRYVLPSPWLTPDEARAWHALALHSYREGQGDPVPGMVAA